MKHLCTISWVLLIIGGINWGLYGWANMDLIDMLLGGMPMLAKIVYGLVGLSGLFAAYKMVTGKCDSK